MFSLPDDNSVQKIIDWVHSSLFIEFILLAATIIHEEAIPVSDKTINEMAFIVADAAQEYVAIASEIGILQSVTNRRKADAAFGKPDLKEQKYLADMGLSDFVKNF